MEDVNTVAVDILEPGAQAIRLPVSGTTDLILKTPRSRGDDRIHIVSDPVAFVVIIELDALVSSNLKGNVGPILLGICAIIFAPAVIQRRFVLPVPGRDGKAPLPDIIVPVICELRDDTFGLPVAGASEL